LDRVHGSERRERLPEHRSRQLCAGGLWLPSRIRHRQVRQFCPWAVLQANINFSIEIGHFTPGLNGDGNSAEAPCFSGPTVPGCIGADTDFDGTSYRRDWADGTLAHPTSIAIGSVAGGGIGPLSIADDNSAYNQPFPIVQFETTVSASETPCQPNGAGCTVPPAGARFYPFYALAGDQGLASTHVVEFWRGRQCSGCGGVEVAIGPIG
jgi:hypothetical protein